MQDEVGASTSLQAQLCILECKDQWITMTIWLRCGSIKQHHHINLCVLDCNVLHIFCRINKLLTHLLSSSLSLFSIAHPWHLPHFYVYSTISLLALTFLESNEEYNGSTSIMEHIRNIVARQITHKSNFVYVNYISKFSHC